MSQGFERGGLSVAKAVELDAQCIETYTGAHSNSSVYGGDVNDFLAKYAKNKGYRDSVGTFHHVHASSPCQGFSGANRNGGQNDKANNDLSLCFVDAVRIFSPLTATFENVMGMWRRGHINYLRDIIRGLLELGYQCRCTALHSCDYGDPQKRQRIIIFAARDFCDLPLSPPKTHGISSQPHITTGDALRSFEGKFAEAENPVEMTEDDVQLEEDKPAPTVLGSGNLPFHYSENRRITVQEMAALQSFPPDMRFYGSTETEKRKQIGNAVPVEFATAIARSIRTALMFRYAEEEDD